jgi:hypothetical protein
MVSSPGVVAAIVRLTNGLPLYATGTTAACPAGLTPSLRLVFLRGSAVVATATVNATACGTVSLSIGGDRPVLLGDGATFGNRVEALATLNGVNPGGPMVPAG